MTDVRLHHTVNGGETTWISGEPVTADGLETAAYLSCFGGNEEDSGLTDGEPKQFWANVEEPDPNRRQRSRLQHLLRDLPLIPANLLRFEDAALDDLAWMVDELGAKVEATASLLAIDRVNVHVKITIGNQVFEFDFESKRGTGSQ